MSKWDTPAAAAAGTGGAAAGFQPPPGMMMPGMVPGGAMVMPMMGAGMPADYGQNWKTMDTRPGDWTCPKCRNNVFASKATCFKCGCPKPAGAGVMPSMVPAPLLQAPATGAPPPAGAPPGKPLSNAEEAQRRMQEIASNLAIAKGKVEQSGAPEETEAEGRKRRRKNRWGSQDTRVAIIPADMDPKLQEAILVQVEIDDIGKKLRSPDLGIPPDPRDRSPSPEPVYSHNGKRLNTREIRQKKKLELKRHELIEKCMNLNGKYRPPTDYRKPIIKCIDRIPIPQEEHPTIGFMGLLIGPRGNTLKDIQLKTKCRVMIRGRGTEKEGKGRRDNRMPMPGDGEPMHAIVEAPTDEFLKKGCEIIRSIIKVAIECPDGQNELKRKQLLELAKLNGTLKEHEMVQRCGNCGSTQHKSWKCPEVKNFVNTVTCTRCGGGGHIAQDCTVDLSTMGQPGGASKEKMDDEYMALMDELGESKPKPPGGAAPPGGPPLSGSKPAAPSGGAPPWASKPAQPSGGAPPWGSSSSSNTSSRRDSGPPPWERGNDRRSSSGSNYGPPGGGGGSSYDMGSPSAPSSSSSYDTRG